jgi:hypothetical protein
MAGTPIARTFIGRGANNLKEVREMKTKFGATVLAAAFLAALVIPWTVLAGGGGGGRGGGGAGGMSGASIGNQTQMQNNFQTRGMDQFRAQDRDQDRDRVRQQIHKVSGTGPAAATTESAVSPTGKKPEKGNMNKYGPGDGTGHIANDEEPPKDGTGFGPGPKQ